MNYISAIICLITTEGWATFPCYILKTQIWCCARFLPVRSGFLPLEKIVNNTESD